MCNLKERFNKERVAFAIIENNILFMSNSEMDDKEWLVKGNIVTESKFNSITRGLIKDNKIYFYTGDFKTNEQVENDALENIKHLCRALDILVPNIIYCGMKKGEIGTLWEPLKTIEIS